MYFLSGFLSNFIREFIQHLMLNFRKRRRKKQALNLIQTIKMKRFKLKRCHYYLLHVKMCSLSFEHILYSDAAWVTRLRVVNDGIMKSSMDDNFNKIKLKKRTETSITQLKKKIKKEL